VYLSDYCTPVSQVAARQHLRLAARHRLVVPRHRLSTYGRRAFAVAGPMTFNALSDELRDPTVNTTTFRRLLKTLFFVSYLHVLRIRSEDVMRYINPRYLLTYLPTTIQDGGRTEASDSHRVEKNCHSVSLITVSMNGVDVLKLLSRMAADTSSIATWLEQPHIILILPRDKFNQYNKTFNTDISSSVCFDR